MARFGAPLTEVTPADLATPGTVVQIGVAPNRIDVLTAIEGVEFAPAWERRTITSYGDVEVALLHIDDLVASKRAAGRPQDLLDVEWLNKARDRRPTRR